MRDDGADDQDLDHAGDEIVRGVLADLPVRVVAALTTGVVHEVARRHQAAPAGAIALGRGLTAGLLLATLTKSVALLALPLWFAWALSRRRYPLVLFGAGVLASAVLLFGLTLFPNAAAWQALTNPVPNTGRSIQHALVLSGSSFGYDGATAARFYSLLAHTLFFGGAAALWLRAVKQRPYDGFELARDFALLLLLACLFVVPFVPWWYSSLVLAAVLFSPRATLIRPSAMTYAICATITLSAGSGLSRAGLLSALLAIVPGSLLLIWALGRRWRWS